MLYLILLLPLALAALSLIRNDRARTVILAAGQVLLLALLIAVGKLVLLKSMNVLQADGPRRSPTAYRPRPGRTAA